MTRGSPTVPRSADDAYVTIAVGQRFRAARRRANLSQQQVADMVGLSRGAVANIELGHQALTLDDTLGAWDERGYYIAGGMCERGGRHSCVYRDGRLAHDPHPSRAGLLSVDTWTLLVPLDPGQWQAQP